MGAPVGLSVGPTGVAAPPPGAPSWLQLLRTATRCVDDRVGWWWVAVAALAVGWCGLPLSDHPDTLRDLLAARDCIQRGDCPAQGATASFGGLHNGALWPFVLAALRWVGAPTPAAWWLVLTADALCAGVLVSVVRWLRPDAPALPHLCGALSVIWLIAERIPNTVWSPSLVPLLCALVMAQWAVAPQDRPTPLTWSLTWGALLALLVDAHPATWPAVALWAWVSAVTLTRPLAALPWACLGFAVAAGLLGPETLVHNAVRLLPSSAAWLRIPIALFILGVSIVLGRRRTGPGRATRPLWPWPLVGLGAAAVLLIGRSAHSHPFELRYWTPASLALAVAIPLSLPRVPAWLPARSLAMLATATAVGWSGQGAVSLGHAWPVVQASAALLQAQGLAWPATTTRVQGQACRRLAAAMQVDAPVSAWQPDPPTQVGIQVVDVQDGAPVPTGWRVVDRRAGQQTLLRPLPLWLDTAKASGCATTPGAAGPRCAAVQPGLWLSPTGHPSVRPGAPYHIRAMPEAIDLPLDPTQETTITFDITVHPNTTGPRRIHVLDQPNSRCPWRIVALRGLQGRIAAAQTAVDVAGAQAPGQLTVAKTLSSNCSPAWTWGASPPCFLELDAPSAGLAPAGGRP